MSYVDSNLLPDERIIFRTKKSLVIFFFPLICLLVSIPIFYFMQNNSALKHVAFAPWVIVFILWSYTELEYVFSDFVVTDKRVMLREGFFVRHTNELRLTAISQVNVEQNLIGQVLGYGTVAINAFGAFDNYINIANPRKFQQAVNQQLDQALKK